MVSQAGGAYIQRFSRDQALRVIQCVGDTQGQTLLAEELGVLVIQGIGGQGKRLGAGNFAALVIDAGEVAQQ